MKVEPHTKSRRLPRFRRSAKQPPFRLTEPDIEIVRLLARHRFLKSTHVAALVGRSIDRTNDRLRLLFHAGYLDRPRAQLDHYPTAGSAPMVYALADKGARLLARETPQDSAEWSRRNREAGRPFIEHQLEVVDFQVALQLGVQQQPDLELVSAKELAASFPVEPSPKRNAFALHATLLQGGQSHDVAVIPDLVFGLRFRDGSRRCFMVEIDRGTMPVTRSDYRQTSIERKIRGYLAAHADGQHEQRFGWKTFRVLTITSNRERMTSMMRTVHGSCESGSPDSSLFYFAERLALLNADPIDGPWTTADGRSVALA